MDVNDEVYVPVFLVPGKRLMAICMGRYVGPTAGVDNCKLSHSRLWRCTAGVEVKLRSFLTSVLNGDEWSN